MIDSIGGQLASTPKTMADKPAVSKFAGERINAMTPKTVSRESFGIKPINIPNTIPPASWRVLFLPSTESMSFVQIEEVGFAIVANIFNLSLRINSSAATTLLTSGVLFGAQFVAKSCRYPLLNGGV